MLHEKYDNIAHIDIESFYNSKTGYSLTKMTTLNYCRDPRWITLGCAVAWNDEPAQYLCGDELQAWFDGIDWSRTAVAAFNCLFDGTVMTQQFNIFPAYYICTLAVCRALLPIDRHNLKTVAPLLGLAGKLDALVSGSKVNTVGMDIYAIRDVEISRDIYKLLYPMLSAAEQDVISLTIRQGVEPTLVLDHDVLLQVRDDAKREREAAILASGQPESTLTSNPQFAKLIRSMGLTPPTKLSDATGEETEAFSKGDDEFVAFMLEYPQFRHIWDGRLAAKSNINITRAEKFISIYESSPKHTTSMPLNYCGAHCVPGDTEVLTRDGWKEIQLWGGGDIAQVREDRSIDFLHADRFIGPLATDWVRVDSARIAVDMTYGHTVPYLTDGRGDWATMKAEDLLTRGAVHIPTTGLFSHEGTITADQMRVLVMLQADGNFNVRDGRKTSLRFKFKKRRKIDRARELLDNIGVVYTERKPQKDGCTVFYIPADAIPQWLREDRKVFGPWLLDSTMSARKAFVEEVLNWDGSVSAEHRRYSSNSLVNATWVSTVCHLTNQAAYISNSRNPNGTKQYVVSIKIWNPGHTVVSREHISPVTQTRGSFCPETKTGYWLARSNGKIFITGNTGRASGADGLNVQNLPNKYKSNLRKAFTAPKGQVIVVVDSAQIELRVNMWQAGQDDKLDLLRDGGDIYKAEAMSQFGIAMAEVTKDQRQYGKLTQLGLGFGMGAKKFQKTAAAGPMGMDPIYMTIEEAYDTVNKYRSGNSKIPAFWRTLDQRINQMTLPGLREQQGVVTFVHEGIELPSGRMLQYPGLMQTEEGQWVYGIDKKTKFLWGGTMCENLTQALARDIVFEQMLEIDKRYRVVSSTHDEVLYLAPAEEAEEALAFGIEIFSKSPAWALDLPLSAEGGFDISYSK